MAAKYVTRQETDIWGNDQIVTRRQPTASDVGGAIGTGLALIVAANRNASNKAAENAAMAAQRHLENGEYEQAIIAADRLKNMNVDGAKAGGHLAKAKALLGLRRYDEAITAYTNVIELALAANWMPEAAIVFIERGDCYFRKNDLGAAMRDFTSYIRWQPNDDTGYYWQGLALAKLGDLDQALENLNRAVSINPGDAANYRERAELYVRRNEVGKAIEDCSRAVMLNPSDPTYYRRRAELYAYMNDNMHAIADYSRMIELTPSAPYFYRARAALYDRIGDAVRSHADMTRATQEETLHAIYQMYLQAATEAHSRGYTNHFTEADAQGNANRFSGNPNRVKAAIEYRHMITYYEPYLPGFDEFFSQFLQAHQESRLQGLEKRMRSFFVSGQGNRAYMARGGIPFAPEQRMDIEVLWGCETGWMTLPKGNNRSAPIVFCATATDPRSNTPFATSDPIDYNLASGYGGLVPKQTPQAQHVFNAFISKLQGEGWTITESGKNWFHMKLRRQ